MRGSHLGDRPPERYVTASPATTGSTPSVGAGDALLTGGAHVIADTCVLHASDTDLTGRKPPSR